MYRYVSTGKYFVNRATVAKTVANKHAQIL